MRLAPLFALMMLASAAHAQQCVPDPTPSESYYPLGVGDEWIYHAPAFSGSEEAYVQRRVLRDEMVGGQTYAVDQLCFIAVADGAQTCRGERLVRFDGSNVIERLSGGESPVFERLDAPFGSNPLGTCADDLGTGPVVIGGTGYTVARVKGLPALDFGPPPFAAGIGPLGLQVGNLAERTDRFEYARVGGVEYGVRPVAGESVAVPVAALQLAATPNPTVGTLRLTLTLPEAQTVTAEAFDALGRRVWQTKVSLSAGAQTLAVDASEWAPGVYVVRATVGSQVASMRLVVAR